LEEKGAVSSDYDQLCELTFEVIILDQENHLASPTGQPSEIGDARPWITSVTTQINPRAIRKIGELDDQCETAPLDAGDLGPRNRCGCGGTHGQSRDDALLGADATMLVGLVGLEA